MRRERGGGLAVLVLVSIWCEIGNVERRNLRRNLGNWEKKLRVRN
jgi:hypothetical protein